MKINEKLFKQADLQRHPTQGQPSAAGLFMFGAEILMI
jgi:hypothetical protein